MMRQRVSRNDLIFLILLAAVLLAAAAVSGSGSAQGAYVRVTVDGEEYGSYPLDEAQEIPIVIDGVTTNRLLIADGQADMTEADCPDQLCVYQKPVSRENETIVCLPNRVVVQVVGAKESEFDSIAK